AETEQEDDGEGQKDHVRQPRPHARIAHVDLGRQQGRADQRQRPAPPRQVEPLGEPGRARDRLGRVRLVRLRVTGPRSCTRAHRVRGVSPAVSSVQVLLSRVDPGVPVPSYARQGDAGADLVTTEDVVLAPGERAVVGTGVAIALPPGYAGFVHPRSGLAARVGLSIVNTPGTIDAGYRGEIKVCLVNLDPVTPIELA